MLKLSVKLLVSTHVVVVMNLGGPIYCGKVRVTLNETCFLNLLAIRSLTYVRIIVININQNEMACTYNRQIQMKFRFHC